MKVNFLVDWFQFTYLPQDDLITRFDGDLMSCFLYEFEEFHSLVEESIFLVGKDGERRGRNGYTYVMCASDEFQIMWNPDHPEMGIHAIFPSHGLHRLCEIYQLSGTEDFCDVKALFERFNRDDVNITRLDIAYDDYSKTFTPKDFNSFHAAGRISTLSQKFKYVTSGGKDTGTVYFGSRGGSSERYLRIYDKCYESNGAIDAIRYELELRKGMAKQVLQFVCEDKNFSFADLLGDMINLTNEFEIAEGNRALTYVRRNLAGHDPKWEAFLSYISEEKENYAQNNSDEISVVYSPIHLQISSKIRYSSMQKSINWIKKYVMPTLSMVRKAIGRDSFDFLLDEQIIRVDKDKSDLVYKYREEIYKQVFKEIVD